jgi:hypothetical protein
MLQEVLSKEKRSKLEVLGRGQIMMKKKNFLTLRFWVVVKSGYEGR